MASSDSSTLRKLFSNKFVLGLLTGFAIGIGIKNTLVAIAILLVISLAWYSASRKKKEEIVEEG